MLKGKRGDGSTDMVTDRQADMLTCGQKSVCTATADIAKGKAALSLLLSKCILS